MAVDYIRERVVFGKPLIKKQALRHRLADWLTEIECLRQLIYHIVRMKEARLDVTREIDPDALTDAICDIEFRGIVREQAEG